MPVAPAIGIDLGTTFSCVAVWQNGKVHVIPNDAGNKTTPSCVSFLNQGHLVGEAALIQAASPNTVFDAKRLIGRNYHDPSVQESMKLWPFDVINDNGKAKIKIRLNGVSNMYHPEQISALVLTKMKETAEAYLRMKVDSAVITVPAYFNNNQRQATKDAGAIAGLNVLRVLTEPTAAAMAFSNNNSTDYERILLVYDLGGGTFDVTILSLEEDIFEVLTTAGNPQLGGQDFDARMVEYFIREFKQKHNVQFEIDKITAHRLRIACERLKRALSEKIEEKIEIINFYGGLDLNSRMTRETFENLNQDLFNNTIACVETTLRNSKLNKSDIHEVILVGGSTRIPKIREMLTNFFDGKRLNISVNVDEAVAYGAAVQAAILKGDYSEELQDKVLLDVTPLSLGIETMGGVMSVLIPRNTVIPTKKVKAYSTVKDNQTNVNIQVFEGEMGLTKDNNMLGRFRLTNIPRMKAGEPQIDVTFSLDADSIIQVTAKEKSTNTMRDITITKDTHCLSQEEIDEMIAKHENSKHQEKEEIEHIQARALLEYYCQNMKLRAANLDLTNKMKVLDKCTEVLQWLRANPLVLKSTCEQKKKQMENLFRNYF